MTVEERDDYYYMDDYQAETNRTEMRLPPRELMLKGAMGLCGEAGEVSELIKKHAFHGKPLDPDKVEEELGDVFWYLSQLARACGTTLRRVATRNAKKLRKRYPEGYSHAASAARLDQDRAAKPLTSIAAVAEPGKAEPVAYVVHDPARSGE